MFWDIHRKQRYLFGKVLSVSEGFDIFTGYSGALRMFVKNFGTVPENIGTFPRSFGMIHDSSGAFPRIFRTPPGDFESFLIS